MPKSPIRIVLLAAASDSKHGQAEDVSLLEPGARFCSGTAALARTMALEPPYGLIMILFSTLVTPGADQAARLASSFSAQERTLP